MCFVWIDWLWLTFQESVFLHTVSVFLPLLMHSVQCLMAVIGLVYLSNDSSYIISTFPPVLFGLVYILWLEHLLHMK